MRVLPERGAGLGLRLQRPLHLPEMLQPGLQICQTGFCASARPVLAVQIAYTPGRGGKHGPATEIH